ncbi:spherulation-specific family 4 protein [Streptococcus sp. H49]|uniref:spherulation-specific family 4 protein n=1 Tax=Streptococcus huangxiaojuni TaxID=3237239 RepID=UPI0034A337E7
MKDTNRNILSFLLLLFLSIQLGSAAFRVSADEISAAENPAAPSEAVQTGASQAEWDNFAASADEEPVSASLEAETVPQPADLTADQTVSEGAGAEVLPAVSDNAASVQDNVSDLAGQSVILPAYRYANQGDDYWTRITAVGGSQIPYVIINPDSGPGTAPNADFSRQIADNRNAGIQNIAYVKTDYFNRSLADIRADVDRYAAFYGTDNIAGIFFDEAGSGTNPNDLQVMADLYTYVKNTYPNMTVIANPGRSIADDMSPYADIWLTSEVSAEDYINNFPQPQSNFENDSANANRIFHLIYAADPAQYDTLIELARQRNAGWLMITDDVQSNPYDELPTDFENLMSRINALGRPADPASEAAAAGIQPTETTAEPVLANALFSAENDPLSLTIDPSDQSKAAGTLSDRQQASQAGQLQRQTALTAHANQQHQLLPETGQASDSLYLFLSGLLSLLALGFVFYRFKGLQK